MKLCTIIYPAARTVRSNKDDFYIDLLQVQQFWYTARQTDIKDNNDYVCRQSRNRPAAFFMLLF